MIRGKDIYEILAAIVPLYVAMILGYGSIRWWKIFTPDQSTGISGFVAKFAIPMLTFNFISPINPYHMNLKFIAADTLQKVVILIALFLWNTFTKGGGGIDWTITLFSLSTLPNTFLVGVPLLNSMYGDFTTSLLIQIVVMQSIVWYNFLLFLYEYRAAKNFISQQLSSVISNKVDSNHGSINGREPLHADVEMGDIENEVSNLDGVSREQMHGASSLAFNRTDLYTSGLQNDGFEDEMLQMHKKRFWRSKSCSDISTRHAGNSVASSDLRTTDASKPVDILQEIATSKGTLIIHSSQFPSKDVHSTDMGSCADVSGDREHETENVDTKGVANKEQEMPPAGGMTKLILSRVWRKLIRNPTIYAAILGLGWSFISNRWNLKMPSIISGSISIMSKAGLGMAMFSLGISMALQPKIIACGKTLAAISMAIRFLVGPAVTAATSLSVGIRGVLLQVSIVQAAIPQGIVPFVFARLYNLHAEVLSTAVIFGMVVALPITLLYYVLLGL